MADRLLNLDRDLYELLAGLRIYMSPCNETQWILWHMGWYKAGQKFCAVVREEEAREQLKHAHFPALHPPLHFPEMQLVMQVMFYTQRYWNSGALCPISVVDLFTYSVYCKPILTHWFFFLMTILPGGSLILRRRWVFESCPSKLAPSCGCCLGGLPSLAWGDSGNSSKFWSVGNWRHPNVFLYILFELYFMDLEISVSVPAF